MSGYHSPKLSRPTIVTAKSQWREKYFEMMKVIRFRFCAQTMIGDSWIDSMQRIGSQYLHYRTVCYWLESGSNIFVIPQLCAVFKSDICSCYLFKTILISVETSFSPNDIVYGTNYLRVVFTIYIYAVSWILIVCVIACVPVLCIVVQHIVQCNLCITTI